MIKIRTNRITNELMQYFLVASVIYLSGDTAWGSTNTEIRNDMITLMAVSSALYYVFVRKTVFIGHAKAYAVCTSCIIFSMILNWDFAGFSWIMIMIVSMLISEMISFKNFITKYSDIIFVISAASVIGIILQKKYPMLLERLPVLQGGGTDALANAIVTVVPKDYIYSAIRNYGIFREPSMYAIYLMIALLAELFYKEKVNYMRTGIFFISIVLTRSMTGFIALSVMIAAYVLYHKIRGSECLIWSGVFLIGIIYLLFGSVQGYGSVIDYVCIRLQRTGSSSHSINSRIASIFVNIYTWLTHPAAGAGAVRSQEIFQINLSKLGYQQGLTGANMITYSLASFGIVFTGYFIYGLYGFSQNVCRRKNVFLVFMVICCCLCGQTMHHSVIPFLLMFYGYESSKKMYV